MCELSDLLEQQNRMIISLLARTSIVVKEIDRIVTSSKKKAKPEDYILAYNALDGSRTTAEIARIVHVNESTMREALKAWEDEGIVYRAGKGYGAKYLGLLRLPLGKSK